MRISDWSSDVCSSDLRTLAELGAYWRFLIRDQRGQPRFIRKADPSAVAGEGNVAIFVQIREIHVIVGLPIEYADRPGVDGPSRRIRRHALAADIAIREYSCRAFSGICDLLHSS